jgi:prolyl-tRNA editing enzyme YbaK/EbsC (Cys-tRNA(Pro) deacylase)
MAAPLFLNKTIRDLHWVMFSPHLLTPHAGVRCLSDVWCLRLCEASLPWLHDLDADPSQLHVFLRAQRNVRRLGFYFAALLEFWMRFCPALAPHEADTKRTVLTQQQVHAGIGGQCAGQLKLVFERLVESSSPTTQLVHLESHVKFFAWTSTGPAAAVTDLASSPTSSHDTCAALKQSEDEALAAYVGPFLGENLFHRVVEMRRKLSMCQAPAVRSFLAQHFHRSAHASTTPDLSAPHDAPPLIAEESVVSESIVRGYLFYPLGDLVPQSFSPHDPVRPRGEHAVPPCAAVSGSHLRGWWTSSLDELLAAAHPESLWAVPGNGADAVGSLGGKLHWLSPAVAVPMHTADSAGADAAVTPPPLIIRGIPSLGVDDCVLLTAVQLRDTLQQLHSMAHGWGPNEPSPNDDGSYPAASLLFQMLPADNAAVSGSSGPSNAERRIWMEASRGFLMPPGWDPTPLQRAIPLGLKSSMRQKQKSSAAMHEVDYRAANELFSVPHTLLAIRTGSDGGFATPPGMDDARAARAGARAFAVGSARMAESIANDDQSLAEAIVADVGATLRKASPALHSHLHALCLAVLAACSLSEPHDRAMAAGGSALDAISRIDMCVRALLASRVPPIEVFGAGKSDEFCSSEFEDGSRSPDCSDKVRGAAISRFFLAKTTVARAVMLSGRVRGAVHLLRPLLCSCSHQRLLASLFFAALASCKRFLSADQIARAALEALLTEAMQGAINLPRSLLVEACQVLEVRAARTLLHDNAAASALCVPVDDVASHVHEAMRSVRNEESVVFDGGCNMSEKETAASVSGRATTLRHVSQLLKQLRVLHLNLVDSAELVTRLVDANQWVYAEQVCCAASEECLALRTAARVASSITSSCSAMEADDPLGLQTLQAAAQDTDASRTECSACDYVPPVPDGQSIETIAACLGGYNRRTDATPSREKRPAASSSRRSLEAYRVQAASNDDMDHQKLLKLLLRLAQQRLNRKLVAKLSGVLQPQCCNGTTAKQHNSTGRIIDVNEPNADPLRASEACASASSMGAVTGLPPYSLPSGTSVECFDVSCDNLQSETALQHLRARATESGALPVIGVDAEWIAGRRIALLQLAAPSFCVLLRLHLLPKDAVVASAAALLPPSLALLLGDVSILKLGVGIAQDLRLLHEQFGVIARGVVDLQILAACSGCAHAGLQRLTAVALGLHLSKRIEIRCSDWEATTLSPDQIDYAASDAHVALDIFSHFYDACSGPRDSDSSVADAVLAWCAPLIDRVDRKAIRRPAGQSASSLLSPVSITHSSASTAAFVDEADEPYPSEQNEATWVEHEHRAGNLPHDMPFDSVQLLTRLALLGIVRTDATLFSSHAMSFQELPEVKSSDGAEANSDQPFRVKSLALFANGSPMVAVLASDRKLDTVLLAQHLQLATSSRSAINHQLRLATPHECITTFGYRPGTVPPLGHRELNTPVVVDAACVSQSQRPLLAGGGDFGVYSPTSASLIRVCSVLPIIP